MATAVRSLALLVLLAALAGCSSPVAPTATETPVAFAVPEFAAGPLVVFTAGERCTSLLPTAATMWRY